ncbi:MAG: M48 family metalloprotease, partial [Alphaproteobacteria bacterium]|nr:M48 family metalloprotease [Alphaproteobacteria bacterium]
MVAQINRIKMTGVIRKLLIVIGMTAVFAFDAVAATPSLLIDDETQSLLDHILRPIFKVADVPYDKNKIHIINDMSLNAFVSDGNHMFINTGTLIKAANVNELTGILAHETGHI